jgi:hypothetical protein
MTHMNDLSLIVHVTQTSHMRLSPHFHFFFVPELMPHDTIVSENHGF